MIKMAKEKQEKDLETGIKADASFDVAVEQKEKNTVSNSFSCFSLAILFFFNLQVLYLNLLTRL